MLRSRQDLLADWLYPSTPDAPRRGLFALRSNSFCSRLALLARLWLTTVRRGGCFVYAHCHIYT